MEGHMSQLPEVREADAAPEIAAIYADIKATAALPQITVTLFFS